MQPVSSAGRPNDLAAALLSTIYAAAGPVSTSHTAATLGEALLEEGQLFLEATSTPDDVELFFESYGKRRQKPAEEWVHEIVSGLASRLLPDDTEALGNRAVRRAIARLTSADT